MAIDPGRDAEGLKQALLLLMEEGLAFRRIERNLESVDDSTRERLVRSMPVRELSPAYYQLGDYLMWLERRLQALHAALAFPAAFEADGLCILSNARIEFENKHPLCWNCGERQDTKFASQCHECGAEFTRP